MTSKNPHDEPWHEKTRRSLAARRNELMFTNDPPLKPGNPFRKGGPLYRPYPKDAQGNLIFFDPVEQNRVEDEIDQAYAEHYGDDQSEPQPIKNT